MTEFLRHPQQQQQHNAKTLESPCTLRRVDRRTQHLMLHGIKPRQPAERKTSTVSGPKAMHLQQQHHQYQSVDQANGSAEQPNDSSSSSSPVQAAQQKRSTFMKMKDRRTSIANCSAVHFIQSHKPSAQRRPKLSATGKSSSFNVEESWLWADFVLSLAVNDRKVASFLSCVHTSKHSSFEEEYDAWYYQAAAPALAPGTPEHMYNTYKELVCFYNCLLLWGHAFTTKHVLVCSNDPIIHQLLNAASVSLRRNDNERLGELTRDCPQLALLLAEANKICRMYAIEYRPLDQEDKCAELSDTAVQCLLDNPTRFSSLLTNQSLIKGQKFCAKQEPVQVLFLAS